MCPNPTLFRFLHKNQANGIQFIHIRKCLQAHVNDLPEGFSRSISNQQDRRTSGSMNFQRVFSHFPGASENGHLRCVNLTRDAKQTSSPWKVSIPELIAVVSCRKIRWRVHRENLRPYMEGLRACKYCTRTRASQFRHTRENKSLAETHTYLNIALNNARYAFDFSISFMFYLRSEL